MDDRGIGPAMDAYAAGRPGSRPRLAEWVREVARPRVEEELERNGFSARVHAEAERLYVAHDPKAGLPRPVGAAPWTPAQEVMR